MDTQRRTTAFMISSALLTGALSALVCFAQASPASQSAGEPAAQSAAPAEASSPNKVVMKVGDAKVTQADVDYLIGSLNPRYQQELAAQGRKPVGDEYAMMLLLSQKAEADHLDASPEIQHRLALEKLQMLAQEEYQKIAAGIQVSPDEVNTYFNAHKSDFPEQAEVREFVIRKKAEDAKAGDPGLSSAEAKAKLAEIKKAVESGTDITAVAKQFNVPNTVMVNPKAVTVRKGEMIPELDKVAFNLQPNQFSEPVETAQAVVLLQLLNRRQPEVKDVSSQIENELKQQKLHAALDDMKAKANIWMDPDYFKQPAPPASSSEAPKGPAQP